MERAQGLTVTETANANLQNQINISIIFNYLRSSGPAYRARIARDLGMSAPAVSRAVERLLGEGYLIESERVRIGNGKKAAQVSIRADRGYIVGLDLLSDPIELAIADFSGAVVYSRKGPPVDEAADAASFLGGAIDEALENLRRESGRPELRVLAIGVGAPAVVDPRTGRILGASLYGNMAEPGFREPLGERYGAEVFVENIANLAAVGEWRRGAGQGSRSLMFIEIGKGIGAGIIIDGNLYRGARGAAGEIGFSLTRPEGLGHDSRLGGYLESVASLAALGRRAREAAKGGAPGPGLEPAEALCRAAAGGDRTAARILREVVDNLAVAIVDSMVLLDPEIVIIGGSLCELPAAEATITRPLIDALRASYPFEPATIERSSLGSLAGVLGALQYALDSLVVHAYPYHL